MTSHGGVSYRWKTPLFDLTIVDIRTRKRSKSRDGAKNPANRSSHLDKNRGSPSIGSSFGGRFGRHDAASGGWKRPQTEDKSVSDLSECLMASKDLGAAGQTASERRMAKYKEERRRQLASQIASRLSSNKSSSSSEDNDVEPDLSNSSGDRKYRPKKPQRPKIPAADSATTPQQPRRQRRRRSLNNSRTDPTSLCDADTEEDQEQHVYQAIGPPSSTTESVPASAVLVQKSARVVNDDKILITSHVATRKPRKSSLPRELPPPPACGSAGTASTDQKRWREARRLRNLSSPNFNEAKSADRPLASKESPKRRSMLNTSYSSEEILFQAASSLQGLEDEFKYSKARPTTASTSSTTTSVTNTNPLLLSSPEMIKSVSRTLTPPISPHHNLAKLDTVSRPSEASPPSSTASSSAASVPISDPMIDMNWPGRPKRNSLVEADSNSSNKRRTTTASPFSFSNKPPIFPQQPPPQQPQQEPVVVPPFMKEFVQRRRDSDKVRPHSAFIPRGAATTRGGPVEAKKLSFEAVEAGGGRRRPSEFGLKCETLMDRAQKALEKVDGVDLLEAADDFDGLEDVHSVDFDEEEVLQRCQDFIEVYENKKKKVVQTPPVPKPRSLVGMKHLTSEDEPPGPSLRTRSSSLTLPEKEAVEKEAGLRPLEAVKKKSLPKPILKKSSDDLISASLSASEGGHGILKANARPDHIRIRSPSPDLEDPRPILRSRNNSVGDERPATPPDASFHPQSILKRRSSAEDFGADEASSVATSGATSRSSPEPPVHGILKRKLSLGSQQQSDEASSGIAGAISSILKKTAASTHSSGQGSLEDLTSASGSSCHVQEGIKSILKKRQTGSTDDELEAEHDINVASGQPRRSILKSRRSEESLSPLSDEQPQNTQNRDEDIRPILKTRDSSRDEGYHSSKLRDKSKSPTRGVTSLEEFLTEMSGSSGFSTPLSGSGGQPASGTRRSSLTFSPKRASINETEDEVTARRGSFVSKATVFLEPSLAKSEDVSASDAADAQVVLSTSLPTSPVTTEATGILKRKGSAGSKPESEQDQGRRIRGVLKKDSSYDESLRPILKSPQEEVEVKAEVKRSSSSSSSSEDLEHFLDQNNRAFGDVVIDPMPQRLEEADDDDLGGRGLEAAEAAEGEIVFEKSPRKLSFQGPRQPVIPPSSVKISADGNLAGKLQKLTGQAEAKLRQMEADLQQKEAEASGGGQQQQQQQQLPEKRVVDHNGISDCSNNREVVCRKVSQDLPASEYYAIYKQSKQEKMNNNNNNQDTMDSGVGEQRAVKVEGGGIADRLAALKKSGEENWKKKKISNNNNNNKSEGGANNLHENKPEDASQRKPSRVDERVDLRHKASGAPDRPTSTLTERLSQLQSSQTSWQAKVGAKDAAGKLTVAGKIQAEPVNGQTKLGGSGCEVAGANLHEDASERRPSRVDEGVDLRRKASGAPHRPTSTLTERLSQLQSSQTSWQAKVGAKDAGKFTVAGKMQAEQVNGNGQPKPGEKRQNEVSRPRPRRFEGSPPPALSEKEEADLLKQEEEEEEKQQQMEFLNLGVDIPENDADLDKFFNVLQHTKRMEDEKEIRVEDFDDLLLPANCQRLTHEVIRTRPVNNNRKRKSRNPLKKLKERTDVKSNYNCQRSVTTVTPEEAKKPTEKDSSKHSHLAAEALAGLAAVEDFSAVQLKKDNQLVPDAEFVPYKRDSPMLLHIKGRRLCQPRLVEPSMASVNSGDAYIAIKNSDVVVWQGKYSNVIERSRSLDLATSIVQRKDLGCKRPFRGYLVFDEAKASGGTKANRLFWSILGYTEVQRPLAAGAPNEDEVFEATVHLDNQVWRVDPKNIALDPVDEFWGMAPKYELLNPCDVLVFDYGNVAEIYVWAGKNAPFRARRIGLKLAKDMTHNRRPEFGIFGKIVQNMETCLFREKFTNWPKEAAKTMMAAIANPKISPASVDTDEQLSTEIINRFDADVMARKWTQTEPNLELEATFLGRGRDHYDAAERRQYVIETLSNKVWHIQEDKNLGPVDKFVGHFQSTDTYVVRWHYKVSLTGRDLKGRPSKHVAVGRERWAYFFWHGRLSTASQQGASALMAVELDKEEGPQVRQEEGHEEAAFLQLFDGKMVVFNRNHDTSGGCKMFIIRGETPEEACGLQVKYESASLRSRGCFWLQVGAQDDLLWLGADVPKHSVEVAERFMQGRRYRVVHELDDLRCEVRLGKLEAAVRMYKMTSVSGEFQVEEVLCPFRKIDVPNAMPFNQYDLYDAEQPGLFLVDAGGTHLYLWQGWWPDVGHEVTDTNVSTGSGFIRWHAERREAMQTTADFCRLKYRTGDRPRMTLVWAGHEPVEFTHLFPQWTFRQDAHDLNQKYVGNSSLEKVLAQLSRSHYAWDELQQRPLPDGVDPSRLEKYLSDEDFVEHLGLTRQDFMAAARWKQLEIRKEKGLF